jgi:putative intracellular protease/amidase
LSNTSRLDDVTHEGFDAMFHPGGHGSLWDLAEDPASIQLIETTPRIGKPFALLCHAPGVLRHAKSLDGKPLIEGKAVTGLTNTKEEAVGLTSIVPFLVQDELRRNGGVSLKAGDWHPYVVWDGLLITGKNPASSGMTTEGADRISTIDDRLGRSTSEEFSWSFANPREIYFGTFQESTDVRFIESYASLASFGNLRR